MTGIVPPHAQCVREGTRYRVYQREQVGFTGEIELYENVVRKSGAIGFIVEDDMIVLAQEMRPHRQMPKICFFGGMMEWDESPQDAIARELLEETGMQGDCTLVWEVDFTVSESRLLEYIYKIDHAQVVQKPSLEPGEQLEIIRMTFDDFIQLLSSPSWRHIPFARWIAAEYLAPGKYEVLRSVMMGSKKNLTTL